MRATYCGHITSLAKESVEEETMFEFHTLLASSAQDCAALNATDELNLE